MHHFLTLLFLLLLYPYLSFHRPQIETTGTRNPEGLKGYKNRFFFLFWREGLQQQTHTLQKNNTLLLYGGKKK